MSQIIYTHCDFDGAASAALVSYVTGIQQIRFATPENIYKQPVSGTDIVCDLPYISGCGFWFDHHASNIQEVLDRSLNPANLAGANRVAPSAAQVIYDYFARDHKLPGYFEQLVNAANIIDTMAYESLDEWLAPSPHNIINETININSESYPAMSNHLYWLTCQLRDFHLDEVSGSDKIQERYKQKQKALENDIQFIRKTSSFLHQDKGHHLVIIDCSNLAFAPKFNKTLALAVYPEAQYILLVASDFSYGRKTNNLKLSLAKNFLSPSEKELGVFLEELGLGGGHDNAAGGMIRANTKKERLERLDKFLAALLEFIRL